MGAFKITLDGGRVASARIAYGGMAATPKRAAGAEAALVGAAVRDADTWEAALLALESDFSPLTDQRAGADYRRKVARILLCKALMEIAGTPSRITRVSGIREDAHAAAS
jgi:xanthine dehydrogenase small subunit